jgi:hypothetical protein
MAHKALIGGTAYSITGGRTLIGGTGYGISKGRALIGGTGYDISFATSSPLSDFTPGSIVKLNESGSPVEFYVAKHDYESGLNGTGRTLLVRKECYDTRIFDSSDNAYANSSLDSWLCNTYLKLLDADIQAAIGTTKFYYTIGNYNTALTTLLRAIFTLSLTELGKTTTYTNVEGTALPIASTLVPAYLNGSAAAQWTRTPHLNIGYYVLCVTGNSNLETRFCGASCGSRPCFTLPGTTLVDADNNVIV